MPGAARRSLMARGGQGIPGQAAANPCQEAHGPHLQTTSKLWAPTRGGPQVPPRPPCRARFSTPPLPLPPPVTMAAALSSKQATMASFASSSRSAAPKRAALQVLGAAAGFHRLGRDAWLAGAGRAQPGGAPRADGPSHNAPAPPASRCCWSSPCHAAGRQLHAVGSARGAAGPRRGPGDLPMPNRKD